MKRTYVLDCGKNHSTLFDSESKQVKTISHEEVLELYKTLEPNSILICEYAHLGCERKTLSLSQPFTAEELLTLYENLKENNITLKLFPQQSTPRACSYSGLEKKDENDPVSIYNLIQDFPQISMMNPPKDFNPSDKVQDGWDLKKAINNTLNVARRFKYKSDEDSNTSDIKFYINKMIEELSDETKDAFCISEDCLYKQSTKNNEKGELRMDGISKVQIYSILACLQDEAGKLRKRKNGKFISWNFAKRHLICMTPFHRRGGVARSNLYHHGMKNYIIRKGNENGFDLTGKCRGGYADKKTKMVKEGTRFTKEQDEFVTKQRRIYCNAIREVFQFYKKYLTAGLSE